MYAYEKYHSIKYQSFFHETEHPAKQTETNSLKALKRDPTFVESFKEIHVFIYFLWKKRISYQVAAVRHEISI